MRTRYVLFLFKYNSYVKSGNGEYGLFLDLIINEANALFKSKTTYSVAKNTTYSQTYTVFNFSNESVTLTLDQVNTGTTSVGFAKTVTIESNKSMDITLEYQFSGTNNHSLVVFRFAEKMDSCKLGVTSSILVK